MGHRWTDEDDETLKRAVDECLTLKSVLEVPRSNWWAGVALKTGLKDVTAAAVSTRWNRLNRREKKEEAISGSLLEVTPEDLRQIRAAIEALTEEIRTGIEELIQVISPGD